MNRPIAILLFLLAVPLMAQNSRTVDAVYTATLNGLPNDARELKVWIALPVSGAHQTISALEIDSPYVWSRGRDSEFGNSYLYTTIKNPKIETLTVRIRFRATRTAHLLARGPISAPSRHELERNLRADRLVTISPRIRKIADEVTAGDSTALTQARAIYDYVLTTLVYDKTKPGWGRGDSERACDIKAGNCTDFHSLFISLVRAKGIPARFIIGFPMPGQGGGQAGGYHCWAEFYVKELGWVAVDPSEASTSSDPILRNFLFANLDFNRVEFTVGRDIRLHPATKQPLNYFINPYAEADGEPAGMPAISLDYRDVPSEQREVAVAGTSNGESAGARPK
jgi:transglutaminase-like putative cysteine protease